MGGARLSAGVLALYALASSASAEPGWTTLAHDDGMLIEARPMPGTKLREIRLSTHSRLEPESILAVLWDVRSQHEFVPNVKELRVLRASDEEAVIYERVKIPVIQDRDYVLRLTKKVDAARRRYVVDAEGASELGPPPPHKVVRMTRLSSSFSLEPAPDGGTILVYQSFGDPGGSVPAWLIRAADLRGPRDFVKAILTRAEAVTKR